MPENFLARLAASLVLFIILIGISVGGLYVFRPRGIHISDLRRPFLRSQQPTLPDTLRSPTVLIGKEFLSKGSAFNDPSVGTITGLAFGKFERDQGQEIVVVGTTGARFLNSEGNVRRSITFQGAMDPLFGIIPVVQHARRGIIQVLPATTDEGCRFLVRRNFLSGAELLNKYGQTIWSYNVPENADYLLEGMAASEPNGDEQYEFAAAYTGATTPGLVVFDDTLKEKWRRPDVRVQHVEFADVHANEKTNIVATSLDSHVILFDSNGKTLKESEANCYIGQFSLVHWPMRTDRECLLSWANGSFRIIDIDGRTVTDYPSLNRELLRSCATPVRLRAGEPEYFAILGDYGVLSRSELNVYDSKARLVYQEVIPATCSVIKAIPKNDTDADRLLVGCNGEVLEYRAHE